MARRGEALREHILDAAKSLFLQTGFDRTSMDSIAARAGTSKRSLYAHFPTKDALFSAVVERVRELFGERMLTPGDYGTEPIEAVAGYCGRLVQLLRWSSVARMLRLGVAEAERFPDLAGGLYDALFNDAHRHLAAYVGEQWHASANVADAVAHQLIGAAIHPTMSRVLFGLEPLVDDLPGRERLDEDVDLDAIGRLAARLLSGA